MFYLVKGIDKIVTKCLKDKKDVVKSSEIPQYNKTHTQGHPSQN